MSDQGEQNNNPAGSSNLAQVLETELVRDAYDQAGGKNLVQEVFGLGEDVVKILRYLPQMVLFTGEKIKRLSSYLDSRVADEQRQLPPAKYALPAFENLAVLDENEALYSMFSELLAMAHDKTQVSSLHPRYAKSLEMMSSDDVLVLHQLWRDPGDVLSATITRQLVWRGFGSIRGEAQESMSPPPGLAEVLLNPPEDAVENLISLGLAEWSVREGTSRPEEGDDEDVARDEIQGLILTGFGFRLLESCMPPEGMT